jgi:cell division protein FtsB
MRSTYLNKKEAVAPERVRRTKLSGFRRYWLSGALILVACGVSTYTLSYLFKAQAKLVVARASRAQLEDKLRDERQKNRNLVAQLSTVTTNESMELAAKNTGFVFPNETIFQKNSGK